MLFSFFVSGFKILENVTLLLYIKRLFKSLAQFLYHSMATQEFQIETICADRFSSKNEHEYYIKWVGFDDSENTWEVRAILCSILLCSFFFLFLWLPSLRFAPFSSLLLFFFYLYSPSQTDGNQSS
jgi:hypothetical protein